MKYIKSVLHNIVWFVIEFLIIYIAGVVLWVVFHAEATALFSNTKQFLIAMIFIDLAVIYVIDQFLFALAIICGLFGVTIYLGKRIAERIGK